MELKICLRIESVTWFCLLLSIGAGNIGPFIDLDLVVRNSWNSFEFVRIVGTFLQLLVVDDCMLQGFRFMTDDLILNYLASFAMGFYWGAAQ